MLFPSYNDDLAFKKYFLLVFVLLNDAMFCAFVVFFLCTQLEFLNASALVFSEFYRGSLLGYGWMVFFLCF